LLPTLTIEQVFSKEISGGKRLLLKLEVFPAGAARPLIGTRL